MAAILRALRRSEDGQALIEYALSVVLFMTLVFGAADFGYMIYLYHGVNFVARAASRWAMVRGSASLVPGTTASDVQAFVNSLGGCRCTATTTWIPNHNPGSVVRVVVTTPYTALAGLTVPSGTQIRAQSEMVISQ